jgi:hypothetical protein
VSFCSELRRALVIATAMSSVGFGVQAATAEPDLEQLVRGAQERAKTMRVPDAPKTYEDAAAVKRAADAGAERGRAALEAMLSGKASGEQGSAASEVGGTPSTKDEPRPRRQGRLVVALSSSMPEAMLREYFRQLDGVPEAIVVLRGFVGGARTVTPTGTWIEQLRRRQADCRDCGHTAVETVVDPLTYRELGITRVPAFAYLPGVESLAHCDESDWEHAEVVFGATTVRAAVEALAKKDARVPKEFVRRLGGA